MALFGADKFARLEELDDPDLWEMVRAMGSRVDLTPVYKMIHGDLTWEQFLADKASNYKDWLPPLLEKILEAAKFVCTTPACGKNDDGVCLWKTTVARGIVIDEAASMTRADLACIWGNCLLPCVLAGDAKRVPPTVMSAYAKDTDGFVFNRLAEDGRISPLEMLQASGFPTFRLHIQLRMARGLFDIPGREFYPRVPFTYSPSCEVFSKEFDPGWALETFAHDRYPELQPPPDGIFSPIFIHCEKSRVFRNGLTHSRRCPGQVDVALDFASKLVQWGVDPAKITVLMTYAANVDYAKWRRKTRYGESLVRMPPVCTIDISQGQENDIVIAVFGTNIRYGVGFAGQAQWLNVLLTRAKCGLVLVGDLKAIEKNKPKGNWKDDRQIDFGPKGEVVHFNTKAIRNVYNELVRAGRVVTVNVGAETRVNEADEADPVKLGKRKADDTGPVQEGEKAAEGNPPSKKKTNRGKKKRKGQAAVGEEKEKEEKDEMMFDVDA